MALTLVQTHPLRRVHIQKRVSQELGFVADVKRLIVSWPSIPPVLHVKHEARELIVIDRVHWEADEAGEALGEEVVERAAERPELRRHTGTAANDPACSV